MTEDISKNILFIRNTEYFGLDLSNGYAVKLTVYT